MNKGCKVRLKSVMKSNAHYDYAKSVLDNLEEYEVNSSYEMKGVKFISLKGFKNKMFNGDVFNVVPVKTNTKIEDNVYNLRTQEDYDYFMNKVKDRFIEVEQTLKANKNLWLEHKQKTCIRVKDDFIGYDCFMYYLERGHKIKVYENGMW
ncbi:hypothetical protein [Vagococcus fessus]|uniref:Uncharacterized protein n=1 Tax=Vagococcus fessus TaxID=120370 RepID=A0A430A573_9ENTE|nr:hypothetical protein [Vagococcus fessus]RSU01947.1 hypothetical protein CBF31_09270 [Vagococcus fessus]